MMRRTQITSMMMVVALLQCATVRDALAQAHHAAHTPTRVSRDSLSAMATALVTRVDPAINNRPRTDALVTQPMLMLRSARFASHVQAAVMLDFERWTMPGGEPVAGIWGEGFIDRRHPHTVLHEVMLTVTGGRGAARTSLSAGRGFVPFGTDDPMVRPFTKFPANHHLAQVMERVQAVAALRLSQWMALEAAVFNGDEPASPTAPPQWSRFGDSRAGRLTVWPLGGVEVQGSLASVRSPEFVRAEGLDHRKRSLSARWTPRTVRELYALVEWARTTETYRGRSIISYASVVGEAATRRAGWSFAVHGEQTTRPEDERLLDPFRVTRPPNHLVIQGLTRWRIATLRVAHAAPSVSRARLQLFSEVARAQSSPRLRPVLLDPRNISGADVAWHVTVGLQASLGAMPVRVGRYGAAAGGPRTSRMPGMLHPSPEHTP